MPQLSVLDLVMFLLETRERPLNIGPLAVLAPPPRARAGFADRLVARMLERPVGAPFNHRLQVPAFGVPRLEVDEGMVLADHVHRVTLEAPGTLAQLFSTVCNLHETLLDRSRPPWELYVIDGLERGRVALYGKVHHGIIDGRSFVQCASNWLSTSPKDKVVRALWEGIPARRREATAQASLADRAQQALQQVAGAAGTALSLARILAQQGADALGVGGGDAMALPYRDVPRVLVGPDSPQRSLGYCTLSLERLKACSEASGATVNDLLLTAIDLGAERYLRARGESLPQPLVAAIPVALSNARGGNQIAVLQCALGEPGTGPLARLAQIQRQTARIKRAVRETTSDTVMVYTSMVHGVPAALKKVGLPQAPAVSNFIFSNPYGFAEKRYLMGAEVELALPVSTVTPGQMLNITSVNLAGQVQLGFLGIPHAVPHIDRLAAATHRAFEQLDAALQKRSASKPVRKRRAAS